MYQVSLFCAKRFRSFGASLFSLLAVFLLVALSVGHAEETREQKDETVYIEGKHYLRVSPAVKVEVPDDKIEVREFFWYGCPHCYALEPYIEHWEKPKDVVFIRTPALLGQVWVIHAYTYYALEALGRLDLHNVVFNALHVDRLRLTDGESMSNFLKQYRVDPHEFRQAIESFLVKTKIKNAEVMGSTYGLRSVPTLVINGRYLVATNQFAEYESVMRIVNFLVEKERERIAQAGDQPRSEDNDEPHTENGDDEPQAEDDKV